jgi:hypothetical protein
VGSTYQRRLILAALAAAILLAHAPVAQAAHHDGAAGPRGAGKSRPPKQPVAESEEGLPKQQFEPLAGATATSLASELGSSGQVDPLSGLGIRNPVCDQPAQIRSRATRSSCEITGTPETTYPASNYGFDVFIPTGITHPVGDFTAAFVTILNGIWLGLLFVLKLILTLLGLAFGLNPFANGPTMARISAAVGRIYAEVTDPWLSALVVCAGIALAYRGLIRRDVAGSVAGTAAAVAMLVLGLWVVHSPRETVGQLAGFSNEVALEVISAPQSGNLSRPVGSYAEAMSQTWSRLVEVPFAGLDFSDVEWALGPPPAEAVKRANDKFCEDNGLALLTQLSNLGLGTAKEKCGEFAEKRYGKPKRVIDLYLRSSPGSAARGALWDYFDDSEEYKPKVAAQGGDGVITRLSMLALFAIGLLGAILLLAWLAIRLFTQAAIAFVLLLAAPFALFFPLLGDSGRRAFRRWGLALLGAIAAKVIYAAFLSIVLLGIVILGAVNGPAGSATGFLLSAAFAWAVFLKRAELIGWINVGEHEHLAGVGIGGLAAFGLAQRLGRAPTRPIRGAAGWGRARASLGAEATRRTARESVDDSARALADQRYREAQRTVAAFESASAPEARRRPAGGTTPSPREREAGSTGDRGPPTPKRYRAAKQLIARAERNQEGGGERWRKPDLARFATEDRELLRRSKDPADHAHRAGYERSRFEQLRGPERERAEQEVEKARKRDAQRLAVAESRPARLLGHPRGALERVRQITAGDAATRRAHLRSLRRERRQADLAPRRNLSRGA